MRINRATKPDCDCPKTWRLLDEQAQRQRITDLEKRCDAYDAQLKAWGEAMIYLQKRISSLEKWRLQPNFRNGGGT